MTKARDLGDFISDGTIAETVTADGLNLGDNEKIQLGAGQDLAIYHDGNTSRIDELGTGNLDIRANDFRLMAPDDTVIIYSDPDDNNSIGLYHQGNLKIKTGATGATVTGTIAVSDSFNATSGTFTVQSNGTDILNLTSTVMSPQTDGAISLGSATNSFNNMYLDGNVFVGTTSQLEAGSVVNVVAASDYAPGITIGSNASATNWARMDFKNTNASATGIIYQDQSGNFSIRNDGASPITFFTNGANERMRIDSSGRVGIGSASLGDATLEIQPATDIPQIKLTQNNVGDGGDGWKFHNSGPTGGNLAILRESSGTDYERMRLHINGGVSFGASVSYGTTGQVLTSNGQNASPTWGDAAEASFTFSATASGSIDANRIAAVNSDGTMSALYSTSSGSVTNVTTTNDARRIAMAPVTDNLYFYMWDDDNTATANANKVVLIQKSTGTVDANVLTVGTPVEVNNDSRIVCDAVYDPDNQRITYFWALGSASTMYYRMYSFSGTTLTQTGSGSFSVQAMTTGYPAYISATYNTTHNCIVLLYKRSSDGSFVAKLIDPGTTSLTIANEYNLGTYNAYTGRAVECAATGAHVFVQQKVSDGRAYVRAGTISGSGSGLSLTLGTEVDVSGANGYGGNSPIGIFDVPENSNYTNTMCVQHAHTSTYAKYCLFSLSGTTVTAQTTGQAYGGSSMGDTLEGAYSPETGKVMQVWTSSNSLKARPINVTAATPVEADSDISISGSVGSSHGTSRTPVVTDGSAYFSVGFVYYTGSTYPRVKAIATTDSNYNQWVGYTESALSDGDSGTFTVLGPITTAPTANPGAFIYVTKDGSLTTSSPSLDGDKLGITTGNGNGIITRVRNYQMYTN